MGKWLGKTINPLGTYRGIYFNKSFTLGEVFEILKQLPYKEIFGAPAYTIFNGHDSNNNYILVLAVSEPQTRWYEIHITKRYNGEIKMYNIRPSSLENEYFDFGFEVTGTLDAEDYNNGEEKYNDLIKTYVSAVPIRYDNSFAIQMHPINEDGSLDKTINLFPKTRLSAIEDSDGNPVEETELELSDAEPSANAKDLKKVLLNGEEWKVSGSGGGEEVLEVDGTLVDSGNFVLDDATNEKIVSGKIKTIVIKSVDGTNQIDLTFRAIEKYVMPDMVNLNMVMFFSINSLFEPTAQFLAYDITTKTLAIASSVSLEILSRKWFIGTNTVSESTEPIGSFVSYDDNSTNYILLNVDKETLQNDKNLATTKAVKAYVDTKIEESVTTALSDDYTIGG